VGFCIKNLKNVINNLTTQDSLLCTNINQQLMDIDTSEPEENTVLFISKLRGNWKTNPNETIPQPPPER